MARQIKAERAAAGWTQAELAERIGKDKQTVMRYEAGTRDVPVSQLGQLAHAFSISPQELLGRAVDRIQ